MSEASRDARYSSAEISGRVSVLAISASIGVLLDRPQFRQCQFRTTSFMIDYSLSRRRPATGACRIGDGAVGGIGTTPAYHAPGSLEASTGSGEGLQRSTGLPLKDPGEHRSG